MLVLQDVLSGAVGLLKKVVTKFVCAGVGVEGTMAGQLSRTRMGGSGLSVVFGLVHELQD